MIFSQNCKDLHFDYFILPSEWKNPNHQKGLVGVKGAVIEHTPSIRDLPRKIDSFSFCKFAGTYFKVGTPM